MKFAGAARLELANCSRLSRRERHIYVVIAAKSRNFLRNYPMNSVKTVLYVLLGILTLGASLKINSWRKDAQKADKLESELKHERNKRKLEEARANRYRIEREQIAKQARQREYEILEQAEKGSQEVKDFLNTPIPKDFEV